MAAKPLPALASIAGAVLRSATGEEVKAASLWARAPVLVFALRRPGCVLCRDTAKQFWASNDAFAAAGVQLVCVVHEWIDREIKAFHTPDFWPGPLYHDQDKAFYKVFSADGQSLRTQSVLTLLNPFSPAWGRIRASSKAVSDHNVVGEGTILGGLLLLRAGDGGIAFIHPEKSFGDMPGPEQVLKEAQAALAAS